MNEKFQSKRRNQLIEDECLKGAKAELLNKSTLSNSKPSQQPLLNPIINNKDLEKSLDQESMKQEKQLLINHMEQIICHGPLNQQHLRLGIVLLQPSNLQNQSIQFPQNQSPQQQQIEQNINDFDEITIPEEENCAIQSRGEELFNESSKKQNYLKVSEKLKKYDGIINNNRGIEYYTAVKNPLVRNKGNVADDWLWETTLQQEQLNKNQLALTETQKNHHRVKSFHQTSKINNSQQVDPPFNLVEKSQTINNSKYLSLGISQKQTQLGQFSKQMNLQHKDSTKNTNLSLLNLFQSSQQIGTFSNNLQMSRIARAPSNIKESNIRLTSKLLNDQMWDQATKQEGSHQNQQYLNLTSSKDQACLNFPLYSQYQSQNLKNSFQSSKNQSVSSKQKNDQLSSEEKQSIQNIKFSIDQEEQKQGGISGPQSQSISSRQPDSAQQHAYQTSQQTYRDRVQPRNKLSSFAKNSSLPGTGGGSTGVKFSPPIKSSKMIFDLRQHPITINNNFYNSNQTNGIQYMNNQSVNQDELISSLNKYQSQHQQQYQQTNQKSHLCENLIYEEIQESSEELKSSLLEEDDDEEDDLEVPPPSDDELDDDGIPDINLLKAQKRYPPDENNLIERGDLSENHDEDVEENASRQNQNAYNIPQILNLPKNFKDSEQQDEEDSYFKKSQTAYVPMRKKESLKAARRPFTRMKSQVVFTVKSQEIQLNKLSKSYVYLIKGLSEEFENIDQLSQGVGNPSRMGTFGLINYNSIFFENDMNLEQYKQTLTDALAVQFQKEKNISHKVIKNEYDKWVNNFQLKYRKTSPHKKTIVFDLDETLVRAQEDEPANGFDSRFKVIESEKKDFMIYVKLRPGLVEVLEKLKDNFELILFTAASLNYANIVLQTFEGKKYFDHILSRNQCLFIEQYKVYIKDLQILTLGRELEDVIIVDNKIESFCSHLENGIPIKSYYGEEDDDRLPYLLKHLMKLKDVRDVRPHIMKDFFLKELKNNQNDCQEGKIKLDSEIVNQCIEIDRDRYKDLKKKISDVAKIINERDQKREQVIYNRREQHTPNIGVSRL